MCVCVTALIQIKDKMDSIFLPTLRESAVVTAIKTAIRIMTGALKQVGCPS